MSVGVDRFDYELPAAAIAQTPVEPRDSARLLVDHGVGAAPDHRVVRELPELLRRGDVLVVNNTRVYPARLHLEKVTGGKAEVLLLDPGADRSWSALVRPGRRLPPGTVLASDGADVLEVGDGDGDTRTVRFLGHRPVADVLDELGEMPLPPYIRTPPVDADRYQTVYAHIAGSAAAPTAGLHLTTAVLDEIRALGVVVATVDLRVGLDTFQPLRGPTLADQIMHTESYSVPAVTLDAVEKADRVVAVGTTTVRALESAALGQPQGRTDLFITPGFDFRVVDALMTNFHVPRSTLLVMLEAFMGERWRTLYADALDAGYRFLSFGDAMFVDRTSRMGTS